MSKINVVSPKVEYLGYNFSNPFLVVERAARLCYKSEDRMTDVPNIPFLKAKLLAHGHTSPFEHAQVLIKVHNNFETVLKIFNYCKVLPYIENIILPDGTAILALNFRTVILLYENAVGFSHYLNELFYVIFSVHPEFKELLSLQEEDYKHLVLFKGNTFSLVSEDVPDLRKHVFSIITDRAIANEIVRHRNLSFSQESTRYVNYSKKELEICVPEFKDSKIKSEESYNEFHCSLTKTAEYCYKEYLSLIDNGHTPQYARSNLPLSLKTELILSGYNTVYKDMSFGLHNFIKLRKMTPGYHPFIYYIADEIDKAINAN